MNTQIPAGVPAFWIDKRPTVLSLYRRSMDLLLGVIITFLLGACATAQAPTSSVALGPCVLSGGLEASCGLLDVPENRAAPDGDTIEVHFAVVPARSSNAQPDPLFMLAGGPGQAAMETFAPLVPLLDEIREDRDIVLVDQRGAGESSPLSCEALENEEEEPDLTDEEIVALIHDCAFELAQEADLPHYMTGEAMRDVDAVRAALGYEQINLYGASYGTRAAQVYAQLFPERIRTLILDSVTAPELVLFQQMPQDGQAALEQLFERCRSDAACHEQFPDLAENYATLLSRVAEEPLPLQIEHPLTGEAFDLTLTEERLSNYVFAILYSPELVSLFPLLVDEAYRTGNFLPLVAQAFMVGQGAGLNPGLLYTIACTEDAPLIDLDAAEQLAAGTLFTERASNFLETCAAFPRGEADPELRKPLVFDAPVLLLSGSADPVTPPKYAEAVAANLPNSHHIIMPGFGHGQLAVGCMPKVLARFLEAGTVADLDTGCLDALRPPPFFLDMTGPGP